MTGRITESPSDPALLAYEITPSDSADQTGGPFRGFMVGGSGNVAIITQGGSSVTLTGVAAGVLHPIRVKRFKSTGTTATAIVAVN